MARSALRRISLLGVGALGVLAWAGWGCAHDEASPPSALHTAAGMTHETVSGDADSAATEPRTSKAEPGETGEDTTPALPAQPGTGGSGPGPGEPPPQPPNEQVIPDTSKAAPVTPHTRQQLEGDRAQELGGNVDQSQQPGDVGDQKQE